MLNPKRTKKQRQHLRNNPTAWENRLWRDLRGRQLLGYKIRRQQGVDNFILDFYCPELKLAIEIDGPTHFTEKGIKSDAEKDRILENMNIKVLRISVSDLDLDYDGVRLYLANEFEKRAEEVKSGDGLN
jgi:very-short-patch-repair endonuclease